MPTIKAEVRAGDKKYQTVTWVNLLLNDDGAAVGVSEFSDKTVQVLGVLGTTVATLEGSMNGIAWSDLTLDGVNPIVGLGMFYVWENPKFIRPKNTGGDGTTDTTVILGMSRLV